MDVSPGLARIEWDVCLDLIRAAMAFGVDYMLGVWVDSCQTVIVDRSAGYAIGRSQFCCGNNDSPFRSGQSGEAG